MNQPNLELINQFFAAYDSRDFDSLHKVLASDAKWIALGHHPLGGIKNGFDEVVAFFDQMGAIMGRSGTRAEKLVMGGNDEYIIECQHVWTNRDDGHNLDHLVCVLWTFKNGQIVEGRHFFADPDQMDGFMAYLATAQ